MQDDSKDKGKDDKKPLTDDQIKTVHGGTGPGDPSKGTSDTRTGSDSAIADGDSAAIADGDSAATEGTGTPDPDRILRDPGSGEVDPEN